MIGQHPVIRVYFKEIDMAKKSLKRKLPPPKPVSKASKAKAAAVEAKKLGVVYGASHP